jgi:FkbM family methyltransferase
MSSSALSVREIFVTAFGIELTARKQQFVEAAGRFFNAPIAAASVRTGFRLFGHICGIKDADYFYDRSERVWIVRSHNIYIAVGFRVSRLWPWVVTRLVKTKLAESRDYWYLNQYEPYPGSIIFDVGAGDGVDTILFSSSAGSTGRVFAIEAHPRTARLLRATCRHNRLQNVTIIETAIIGSDARLTMTDDGNRDGNYVIRDEECREGVFTGAVSATTLDAICRTYELPQIDFLKMNIEGAELDAIKGMTNSILKVRCACIACHDFISGDADEPIKNAIKTYMTSNGFEVYTRSDDERPWARDHVHCLKRSQFA